jgi:hypothetical protein
MSARTEVQLPKSNFVYHTPNQANVKQITNGLGGTTLEPSSADKAAALERGDNDTPPISRSQASLRRA